MTAVDDLIAKLLGDAQEALANQGTPQQQSPPIVEADRPHTVAPKAYFVKGKWGTAPAYPNDAQRTLQERLEALDNALPGFRNCVDAHGKYVVEIAHTVCVGKRQYAEGCWNDPGHNTLPGITFHFSALRNAKDAGWTKIRFPANSVIGGHQPAAIIAAMHNLGYGQSSRASGAYWATNSKGRALCPARQGRGQAAKAFVDAQQEEA